MKNSARTVRVLVSADGRGLVSRAGSVLLWETMRVSGLARGLSRELARWRAPRAVHDPGKIAADLAAAVALGGDCLADIAVLREQPQLADPVASDPVVSRLVRQLAADGPRALKAIRAARAAARERAWDLAGGDAPGSGSGLVTVDLDATIVIAHSEKEQASATWKKTFGFHPMTAFADHGADGNGEPLAIVLRAGNAGSNTAADHIEATRLALAQLAGDCIIGRDSVQHVLQGRSEVIIALTMTSMSAPFDRYSSAAASLAIPAMFAMRASPPYRLTSSGPSALSSSDSASLYSCSAAG